MTTSLLNPGDLAPTEQHGLTRCRRLVFIFITLLLAGATSVMIGEGVFRLCPGVLPHELQVQLAAADSKKALYTADALLEHRAVPGFDAEIPHSECPHHVRTRAIPHLPSGWGFRTPTVDPERPVRSVVIGDSMAFGYGVAEDETLAGRLREELAETGQVVNLGLSNKTGTIQYELILTRFLEQYRPDEVIVLHFENDYTDDAFFEKWQRMVEADASLSYPTSRRIDEPAVDPLTLLKRQSIWAALISNARRKLAKNAQRVRFDGAEYVPAWDLLERSAANNMEARRGYKLGLAALERIFAACRDASANVTVVMIPSKEQALAADNELEGYVQLYRQTADFCRRQDVTVVELLEAFRSQVRRQQIYFPVDGHLTALGNAQMHRLLNSALAARAENLREHVARAARQSQ